MKCPRCQVDLVISDRQGVEIDFCPQCRGVWLDRGELDKVIERASRFADDDDDDRRRTEAPRTDYDRERYDRERYDRHYKKRKSFWTELFD
jgi:Zn-finger nucleic acid-binding protein